MNKKLIPDIDYYINAFGDLVFTEHYHKTRGHCCQSGCYHCPYGFKDKIDPSIPAEFRDAWAAETYTEDESDEEDDKE